MSQSFKRIKTLSFMLFAVCLSPASKAQVTNNSSALTNSAAPSASSVTTGGTNINYQTNNQWSNEVGFGPGIFCRTPTFYVGGSGGTSMNDVNNENYGDSGNFGQNFTGNVGILVPFGSSTLRDCARMSAQIVRDRQISTELSMIRACASLQREGIEVDPQKYPLLAICALDNKKETESAKQTSEPQQESTVKNINSVSPQPEAMHNSKPNSSVKQTINP